jgi:catechol 2,3-dioxygenase-like lactoylglutathione lyase family enzyme
MPSSLLLGLRTIIYPAADLAASKAWYTRLLGIEPYFDQPFYVGFTVAGYELGLLPDADAATTGPITYWGVADVDKALVHLHAAGAGPRTGPDDVGDNIRVATVVEPGGAIFGIIENPHYQQQPPAEHHDGPGR